MLAWFREIDWIGKLVWILFFWMPKGNSEDSSTRLAEAIARHAEEKEEKRAAHLAKKIPMEKAMAIVLEHFPDASLEEVEYISNNRAPTNRETVPVYIVKSGVSSPQYICMAWMRSEWDAWEEAAKRLMRKSHFAKVGIKA